MFEVFVLAAVYILVALVMSFLPDPNAYIIVEIVRWCLFAFGSWTLVLLFFNARRVATDIHSMTIGRPDTENLPDWAELDADGNVKLKDDKTPQ